MAQVGIKRIALEAKVSYAVASLALSDKRHPKIGYSEETRERILRVAERLNYRPNRSARNLRSRRHNAIAIYTGQSIYSVHDRLLNKLLECCRRNGVFPVIETSPVDGGMMPVSLLENAVDGAIFFADIPEVEKTICRLGLPAVFVNTNSRTLPQSISYDEESGVCKALELFQHRSRKKIGFIFSASTHYSSSERLKYMKKNLGDRLVVLEIKTSLGTEESRKEVMRDMREWMLRNPTIDGVLLSVDLFAPIFYKISEEIGKKIGEDISVIAYNDDGLSQLIQPELTALSVNYSNLAEMAFVKLAETINSGKTSGPEYVEYALIVRASA